MLRGARVTYREMRCYVVWWLREPDEQRYASKWDKFSALGAVTVCVLLCKVKTSAGAAQRRKLQCHSLLRRAGGIGLVSVQRYVY